MSMDLIVAQIEFLEKAVGLKAADLLFKTLTCGGSCRPSYEDAGRKIKLNFIAFDDQKHQFIILTVLDEKHAANPELKDGLFFLIYNYKQEIYTMQSWSVYGAQLHYPGKNEITSIVAHNGDTNMVIENVLNIPEPNQPYIMVCIPS